MAGVATRQLVSFEVFVDLSAVLPLFDVIEIWRSRLSEQGPFEEVTGPVWAPASFAFPSRSYNFAGKELLLSLNESSPITVSLTGNNPMSASDIAAQIQTAGLGLLQVTLGVLTTVATSQPGAGVSLRILPSDVAALLGLPTAEPASVSFGTDARVPLRAGISHYTLTDPEGSADFFYRIRFRSSQTGAVSAYSSISVSRAGSVTSSSLVRGTIRMVDLFGAPLKDQGVLIYNSFDGTLIGEQLIAGGSVRKLTDSLGEADFLLIRGSRIRLAVEGTSLVREILVPTDPSIESFNLLDGRYGKDDLFTVQVPDVPFAVRRSL